MGGTLLLKSGEKLSLTVFNEKYLKGRHNMMSLTMQASWAKMTGGTPLVLA
jgi:hypothetical protein